VRREETAISSADEALVTAMKTKIRLAKASTDIRWTNIDLQSSTSKANASSEAEWNSKPSKATHQIRFDSILGMRCNGTLPISLIDANGGCVTTNVDDSEYTMG
jgi:hypothetical protein